MKIYSTNGIVYNICVVLLLSSYLGIMRDGRCDVRSHNHRGQLTKQKFVKKNT